MFRTIFLCITCFPVLLGGLNAQNPPEQPPYSSQTWDTESGLPQNSVHAIAQTSDGYMWFGTEGGLARFDSARFTVFNTRNTSQLRSDDIHSLLVDANTLWIATGDGVSSYSSGAFQSYTAANGLPGNNVTLVYHDAAHSVCAATSDGGSACLHSGHFEASPLPPPSAPRLVDPALKAQVNSSIICSFTDREGDLWVGTDSTGVAIFRSLPFRTFSDSADNLDDVIRCLFRDRVGTLWIGTNSQGLVSYANGKFKRLTVSNGLSSNVIVSLGEDRNGNLYVGTPDGLNRIHNGSISGITSADGLPDDFVRSIYGSADGSLWIGTRRGLSLLQDGKFQTFTHADGLGSDLVGSIVADSKGELWIATLQGLTRFSSGKFSTLTTSQGLTSNVITALYQDSPGALWIGTQGGGLNRLSGGTLQHFPKSLGLPEVIYGITEDANHFLWLASDTGIFRVSRPLLEKPADHPEVVSFGAGDGLRVSECSGGGHPEIASLQNGSIWFATRKGVAVTDPANPPTEIETFVSVEAVTVNNRVLNPRDLSDIAPGNPRIAFDYAALCFKAPSKVSYRYQLHGFDKGWLNAGAERTASYTNLAPGDYRFEVQARNEEGVWSLHPASVAFRMLPHFYQTFLFAAIIALALALSIYGLYKWRVAQVEAQFAVVLKERNRIAREIHDTLAQGFAGISVQLELVSRKLSATNEAARQHLDEARMLVRSSLAEARRSIWELRSQSAEIEDLASRLAKMANQMSGSKPGQVTLEIRGTYRPLSSRTEDELLRIAQEAVTNALRHANASRIQIELAFDPNFLHMTITDDGRGFAPETIISGGVNGHFGLQGMRERAEQIGAGFHLQTSPDRGTTVSIEAPVS